MIQTLPRAELVRGLPYEQTLTIVQAFGPVDFTGYTCAFKLAAQLNEPALVTGACTANSAGEVVISLTAAQTLALEAMDQLGPYRKGVFQVELISPAGDDDMLFHGDFYITGRIE